jgi:hypothetical protein
LHIADAILEVSFETGLLYRPVKFPLALSDTISCWKQVYSSLSFQLDVPHLNGARFDQCLYGTLIGSQTWPFRFIQNMKGQIKMMGFSMGSYIYSASTGNFLDFQPYSTDMYLIEW